MTFLLDNVDAISCTFLFTIVIENFCVTITTYVIHTSMSSLLHITTDLKGIVTYTSYVAALKVV